MTVATKRCCTLRKELSVFIFYLSLLISLSFFGLRRASLCPCGHVSSSRMTYCSFAVNLRFGKLWDVLNTEYKEILHIDAKMWHQQWNPTCRWLKNEHIKALLWQASLSTARDMWRRTQTLRVHSAHFDMKMDGGSWCSRGDCWVYYPEYSRAPIPIKCRMTKGCTAHASDMTRAEEDGFQTLLS